MTSGTRRWLIGLAIAGFVGFPLLLASYFSLGLFFAPPWPKASTAHIAPLVSDALWVRAAGGAAGDLNHFTPVALGQFAACILLAETESDAALQDARQAACQRQHLPPLGALEYLSTLHLRETSNMTEPGFKEGHARFVTTVWMARTFTKAELLGTLAARGEFGAGFKGIEAAAQGYFGRTAEQLTLPQAAMIAALAAATAPIPGASRRPLPGSVTASSKECATTTLSTSRPSKLPIAASSALARLRPTICPVRTRQPFR